MNRWDLFSAVVYRIEPYTIPAMATDIITNVVIGLVMFALMWAGLNYIVPGGAFA